MDKILTIVIPTYNMEKYLDKCLTSLIINDKELMKQLEVLVVIDGATDRSSEIAHTYQDKYPETFHVIDKENGNYGSCVNRGLKEAKGKYIKILDADDSFDNNVFKQYISWMMDKEFDMLLNNYCIVDERDNVKKEVNNEYKQTQLNIFEVLKRPLAMHSIAYRTQNLRQINYKQTEGISYTDQEWLFAPITSVKTVAYYPNGNLYRYLIGRQGQTVSKSATLRSISHSMIGTITMLNFFKDQQYGVQYTPYLNSRIIRRLKYIYNTYLIYHSQFSLLELKEFDEKLKYNNNEFYSLLAEKKVGGIKYIKKWRTNNYKQLSLINRCYLNLVSRLFTD